MTYDIEQRVRARTRRAFLWAALGLVVAVIATVVVIVVAQGPESSNQQARRETGTPTVGGPEKNQPATVAPAAIEGITWAQAYGVWFPVSPISGPKNRANGLASDFSRDPLGAALASIHIADRAGPTGGPKIFEPTIKRQVIGDENQEFLAQTFQDYEQERQNKNIDSGEPLDAGSSNYAGFQIEHYDKSYAAIHLLLVSKKTATTPEVSADFRVEVRWVDNDWRLVAPVDQSWESSASPAQQRNVYLLFRERE